MKNLTDWFAGCVKPVHQGVYERYLPTVRMRVYSYWDGFEWGLGGGSAKAALALHIRGYTSMSQDSYRWRGLRDKPD